MLQKWSATLCCLGITFGSYAQQPIADTTGKTLEEVVLSANKFGQRKKDVAQKIDIISAKQIAIANVQNTGDLLLQTGNVFVQKSQQGGSSPVIRGFEASRVLLVVDGVRYNNAIFRAGHLQNIITVDQNMLERVELLYGPSSTLFGSDALGGVVHLITKPVKLAGAEQQKHISGNGFMRYSSANHEKTGHIDFTIAGKKWGSLTSFTFSDFDDMRMGNRYLKAYPNFGRRSQYIANINGIDSIVSNTDDRIQKFSGYRQWDVAQKIVFQPNEKWKHQLNLQLSNTNNIPRYDRLQDVRNGNLRWAEWYYGPQLRQLAVYTLEAKRLTSWIDQLRLNVNFQHVEESRQQREYRRYDRFDSRRERVQVFGAVIDLQKQWQKHNLTYGADLQLNDVKSVADRTNLLTGAVSPLDTRYNNGVNKMNYSALFAQHQYKSTNKKWVINDGLRLQWVELYSTIADNRFFNLPVTKTYQQNWALTGNIGIVHHLSKSTRIHGGLASGFRAPNIDDLAKTFESSTNNRQVIIPNSNIQPEFTYTIDGGIEQQIGSWLKLEASAFYTWFNNALVLAPTTLNGKDSIVYNGVQSAVLSMQNVNKARVYGYQLGITVSSGYFSLQSTLSDTKGYFITDPSKTQSVYEEQTNGSYALVRRSVSRKPLDHIPPIFGRTGIKYQPEKWLTEVWAMYNGWKRLDEFNADGEDNAQYATADGMPGWWTLNWRAQVQFAKHYTMQLSVENILDRNYRYFASGFSAPGRNLVIGIRAGF